MMVRGRWSGSSSNDQRRMGGHWDRRQTDKLAAKFGRAQPPAGGECSDHAIVALPRGVGRERTMTWPI